MTYAVSGLPIEIFQPLFGLSDEDLAMRGVVRRTAIAGDRFPCRVTLENSEAGQTLLLLNFEDHRVDTPYRSAYAIFVNETATATRHLVDETPPVFHGRPIALRAFDKSGMLVGADLAIADDVEAAIERQFAKADVAYLHAHNAAHGCFAARIDRA
jgi:hypothetical protein